MSKTQTFVIQATILVGFAFQFFFSSYHPLRYRLLKKILHEKYVSKEINVSHRPQLLPYFIINKLSLQRLCFALNWTVFSTVALPSAHCIIKGKKTGKAIDGLWEARIFCANFTYIDWFVTILRNMKIYLYSQSGKYIDLDKNICIVLHKT